MRNLLKRALSYITRSWEEETGYTHPGVKILPPFILEILSYLIALTIVYHIVKILRALI